MSAPVVVNRGPACVELKAGRTYFWCSCGRSKRQPFCDGSHAGTGLIPMKFTAPEDSGAVLCGCKHSGTSPFCDGPHANCAVTDESTRGQSCHAAPD